MKLVDEQLTPHFKKSEFACKCGCGYVYVNSALLYALEAVRGNFGGKSVTIDSGCRCRAHNRSEGGRENSRHLYGEAADIRVAGVPAAEVADFCESLIGKRGGVGRYENFTHIDVRGAYSRWRG